MEGECLTAACHGVDEDLIGGWVAALEYGGVKLEVVYAEGKRGGDLGRGDDREVGDGRS